MSRVPIATAKPAATPSYLAHMLRVGAPPRPKVQRAVATASRARPTRAVVRHRARPAAPAPVMAARQPTPFVSAQQEVATPAAYALIASTICENGPAIAGIGPDDVGAFGPDQVGVPATGVTTFTPDDEPPPEVFVDFPPPPPEPTGAFPPTIVPPIEPPVGPPTTPIGGVPEPGTWAMLLVGFGGIGGVLRRARANRERTA